MATACNAGSHTSGFVFVGSIWHANVAKSVRMSTSTTPTGPQMNPTQDSLIPENTSDKESTDNPWLDPTEESAKTNDSTLSDYAAFILVGPGLLSFILFQTVLLERIFT